MSQQEQVEAVQRLQSMISDFIASDKQASAREREDAFTSLAIDHLLEIGRVDDGEVACWEGLVGRASARINGFGLSDERDTLDLFATRHFGSSTVVSVRADDLERLVKHALKFAEWCLQRVPDHVETGTALYDMATAINNAGAQLRRIRIFVLTDGVSTARKMPKSRLGEFTVEVEIWDATRLTRSMSVEGGAEPIELDLRDESGSPLPILAVSRQGAEFNSLMFIAPGRILADAYEDHGARLLEYNVRSFLSVRGKVNKGIRETIQKQPSRFIAYNNGIVMTAEAVEEAILPTGQTGLARLIGVQIVNGGQTTATIHDSAKRLQLDISEILVPVKVIVVESDARDEIVKDISTYANTQNPMQQADLSANEPFHIAVERLAQSNWCPGGQQRWFYERARGQYEVEKARASRKSSRKARFEKETPKDLRFTKVDLAKFTQAWDRRPFHVSLGGQKNFTQFMEELRKRNGTRWEPDTRWYQDLIAVALVWKAAERVVKWEGIPAFRANVVAYLIASLSSRAAGRIDLQKIWNAQAVSVDMERMLRRWVIPIRDAMLASAAERQRNPTEWFKKDSCWEQVEKLDLPLPAVLPPEFTKAGTPIDLLPLDLNSVTRSDLEAARRVKSLGALAWAQIAEWGSRTGRLHWRQAGIASTLSGMAARGWERNPSEKQVNAAIQILTLAERELPELNGSTSSAPPRAVSTDPGSNPAV